MSELLKYQYQARERQVIAILEKTNLEFIDEIQAEPRSFSALDTLLTTPPILLRPLVSAMGHSEDEFFNSTFKAAEITAKRAFVLEVLLELLKTCDFENRGSREVGIDLHALMIPQPFRRAYADHPELLDRAATSGKESGVLRLFSILEDETPLMRYRSDIVNGRFETFRSLDGGVICFLETKIPGVSLRLWYPRLERLPITSLAVKDLG